MVTLFPADSPLASDLVVIVELAMATVLLIGMFLARQGRIRAHKYVQSSVVLFNLPVVLSWMVPQYIRNVLPGIPAELGQGFYLFPTMMLILGAVAESLGIYILLVAGTNLLPERMRFRRYALWMRTELVLWWSVIILGLTTYYVWYAPH